MTCPITVSQASPVKVAAAAVVSLTSSVATTWALRRRGVEPVYSLLPLCMQVGLWNGMQPGKPRNLAMWTPWVGGCEVSGGEGPRCKKLASCFS